jgi:hypothetical protein
MEINKETGLIDVDKLRTQSNAKNPLSSQPNRFANSPYDKRTLNDVLIDNLNVVGKHRMQNEQDFDMTYHYLPQVDNGRLMQAHSVSDFNLAAGKAAISKNTIDRDYQILETLFETEEVEA